MRARLLDRAVEHVSNGWFPPQQDVLEKIRTRFEAGDYQEDRQELTRDLKEDFALYMYCLKALTEMVERGEIRTRDEQNVKGSRTPNAIVESAELGVLRAIFEKTYSEISMHSMKEMSELQALRFQESMISASTAEVLAESANIDPEIGYSCGL
ncbi:MAG: hypothetical protein KDD44_12450, partial [Bdellovibrionales bacterium]|nr:hypothetical protein [Bdellovibrionales bacterium]